MSDSLELLSDEGMREFIRKGFVTFEADMPAGFHQSVSHRHLTSNRRVDRPSRYGEVVSAHDDEKPILKKSLRA